MMKKAKAILLLPLILFATLSFGQKKVYVPGSFDKVVVSPHIEVTFEQGAEEQVKVMSITEPLEKFNVDLKKGKLHLYLDGAKISTKTEKKQNKNWSYNEPIYKGTVAKVVVVYNQLESCDLRGEEHFLFKDEVKQHDFKLAIYGEADVVVNQIEVDGFNVAIYGESKLLVKKGKSHSQKITAYGDSQFNLFGVENQNTKLTTYGEGEYYLTVHNDMKVTSFGESQIEYYGDPGFSKKIILGETTIKKAEY